MIGIENLSGFVCALYCTCNMCGSRLPFLVAYVHWPYINTLTCGRLVAEKIGIAIVEEGHHENEGKAVEN